MVTFACYLVDIIAQTKSTPMQGSVKFVGAVGDVLKQVEYAEVELVHVLNYQFGHKTAPDEILQVAFGYPLRIFDIALAIGELLDEI